MKRIRYFYKSEQAFTLVEVVASLTIITIILLGTYQLIISTNETAVYNNQRLVAINLGKATIERVKMDPYSYFGPPDETGISDDVYTSENCQPDDCEQLYNVLINDKEYNIELKVSQSEEEKKLKLIDVVVTVKLPEENIIHQVEGYVNYETYQ